MRHVITIASHKGGVGKTTTALNLAFALSRIRAGVLVVDADPQGALGITSNIKKKNTKGLADIISGRVSASEAITATRDGKMSMLGIGELSISDLFKMEELAFNGELRNILQNIIAPFDFVIFDAPAGVGPITRMLLAISTSVIMPINSKNTTARSIPLFLKILDEVKNLYNPDLVFDGIVFTMLDYSNPHELSIKKDLQEVLPAEIFFETNIIYNPKYEAASLKGVPIGLLADGKSVARDYNSFAMEVLNKIVKHESKEEEYVEELF